MNSADFATTLTRTAHTLVWDELKTRIRAVRDVMRHAGILYGPEGPDLQVPDGLRWARIACFSNATFSIEAGRWYITERNGRRRREEIPASFLDATPAECRAIARAMIHAGREAEKTAEIRQLEDRLELLRSA